MLRTFPCVLRAIRFRASGHTIGICSVNGGVLRNCATGVLFDDVGGGATRFPSALIVADSVIEATTAAITAPAGVYWRIGGNASTFGANIFAGLGDPNGNVTARVGSLFLRQDGGVGTTLYVKETGTASAGWIAK